MRNQSGLSGFTLVELSIVLVILGLLIGGVLAGKSLIRVGEMRSIMADLEKFNTAYNLFREKYAAIPGDMSNATDYWGMAGGTGSNTLCFNTTGIPPATCNGNGDGIIQDPVANAKPIYEDIRAWQHLSNAGLVEGKFSGRWSATWDFDPGVNVPKSQYGSAIYYLWGEPQGSVSGTTRFAAYYGNAIFLTGPHGERNIMKPAEAWSIDKKIDDGNPGLGIIISNKGDATYPCTSNAGIVADDPAASYTLSRSDKLCTVTRLRL